MNPVFYPLKAIKKLGNSRLLFVLLPYIVLAFFASYFAYQRCWPTYIENGVRYTRYICGKVKSAEKLSVERDLNEKLVTARAYSNREANYWEMVDTSKTPLFPTGLRFYETGWSPTILKWNNFLLGISGENYININSGGFLERQPTKRYTLQSYIRSIRIYNIGTGETFDISLDVPIWGEIWHATSQLVDDTYYFGVGGAFGPNLGYKLNLPPQRNSRIIKLKEPLGNSIEKIGGSYISSFCYEGCTYQLFNPASSTTVSLERMSETANDRNCSRKEILIGLGSRGRMIINVRKSTEDLDDQGCQLRETESIVTVPLRNEQLTIPLLQTNDLPEKMYQHFMINGIDKILMFGKSKVFIYDIQQNELEEIMIGAKLEEYLSSEKRSIYLFHEETDRLICFGNGESFKYAIDLITETYLDTAPKDCRLPSQEKSIEEKFRDLNLPDNLELLYVPREYKTYDVFEGIPESELPEGSEIIESE